MNRRSFLQAAASLLPLPAFVKAASLWLSAERPRTFATGGIIDPPCLALIGNYDHRNDQETIIPLSNGESVHWVGHTVEFTLDGKTVARAILDQNLPALSIRWRGKRES